MSKMVQEAIEALKELPEDRQATIAGTVTKYATRSCKSRSSGTGSRRTRATVERMPPCDREFPPNVGQSEQTELQPESAGPLGCRVRGAEQQGLQ